MAWSHKDRFGNPIDNHAYMLWLAQRNRCYVKSHKDYHRYGGRGIEVKYSSEDFRCWFRNNVGDRPLKGICISRKDHDGHYEFGNICIQTMSENAAEARTRFETNIPRKPVNVFLKDDNKFIGMFKSARDAGRFCDVSHTAVGRQCNKNTGSYSKYIFRWADKPDGT